MVGTIFHWLQDQIRFTLGIVIPCTVDLIPRKAPVATVYGAPVYPAATATKGTATEEEIDELMETYEIALRKLFDKHKAAFAPDRSEDLRIEW